MKIVSIREAIMFCVMIVMAFFLITKKYNNNTLDQDKIRNEERIKMYQQLDIVQHHLSDSLAQNISMLEKKLSRFKTDTIVITKKYEKIRSNITLLHADSSIGYLSKRLSQAGAHK